MTIAQFRGYLFEILISNMLNKNGFMQCEFSNGRNLNQNPCEIISKDGEIQGRGTKHQIDYIGIFTTNIPFVFPIRILVECKYYKRGVFKNTVREFIGVYKDIEENYFYHQKEERVRFLNVPIIFSATFFQDEAINLAWAHGINLISYYKIPLLKEYLKCIDDFLIKHDVKDYLDNEDAKKLKKLFVSEVNVPNYETFLFATTERGLLINLISRDKFPDELFYDNDEQNCGIYFEENYGESDNQRVFYIQLHTDDQNRKFYFQANTTLLRKEFAELPLRERINEKMRYFRQLTLIKKINNQTRIIKLNVNFENLSGII